MIKLNEKQLIELSSITFDYEDKLQVESNKLIQTIAPELTGLIFHPKNEQNFGLHDRADDPSFPRKRGETDKSYFGRLGAFYGGKETARGMVAGVPDWCIKWRGIFYAIELKIDKPGSKLSEAQVNIHNKWNMDFELIQIFICRNLVDVYHAIYWILNNDFKIVKQS